MKRILAGTLVTLTAATAFALTGAVPASAAEETVTDTPGAPIVVDSARHDYVTQAGLPEEEFFADSFTSEADKAHTAA